MIPETGFYNFPRTGFYKLGASHEAMGLNSSELIRYASCGAGSGPQDLKKRDINLNGEKS